MIFSKAKIAFFLLLTFFISFAISQVLIPYGFFSLKNMSLLISDGPSYYFGSIGISAEVDKSFNVTNSGAGVISTVSGVSFTTAQFYFKDGAFPGTGGTCGVSTLSPGQNCTVIVTTSSTLAGSYTDTLSLRYTSGQVSGTSSRTVTAFFSGTPTRLSISTSDFIKVNTCVPVTIQSQDNFGNALNVGANTTVTLIINNAVNTNFYTTAACSVITTTRTITAGTNSVIAYVMSTTANQSGILVASAATLSSGQQNVLFTSVPTKLFINAPPRIKINTCTAISVNTLDANGFNSSPSSTVTVNLTTSGTNLFYSDDVCSASITSIPITTSNTSATVYTQNATIEVASQTATATGLTSHTRSVNFATSLTWWDTNWAKRIRIDINNSDQGVTFTDQPVLVKLNTSRLSYADAKSLGEDIRLIASDDVTTLSYEIEKWNPAGESLIWVKIPTITASTATEYFYLYYNNSIAADAQSVAPIWTNYWAVWHLHQNPLSVAPQFTDATGNGRNGTRIASATQDVFGAIGNAVGLLTATDAIQISVDLAPVLGASSTLSFWMKSTQTGNNTQWLAPGITGVEQSGGGNDIFFGWIDAAGFIGVTAGNGAAVKSTFVVNNNAWRHVTISRNPSSGVASFYINGVLAGSAASEVGVKTTAFNLLGEIMDTGGSPVNYNGYLDEVRAFNSILNADRIKADFKFMMDSHLFYNTIETYP